MTLAYSPVLTQQTTFTFNSIPVAGVVSIKGIDSGKATEIPVTTLASTAKEFRQGLQDFGSITLSLIRSLDDPGQAAMFTASAAQASETCVVTLPAGPTGALRIGTFTAFVTSLPSDIDKDGVVMGDATLRITGPVVWTAAA